MKKILVILIGLICVAGSCDHTELSGEIIPSPVEAKVGDTISLSLSVPEEMESIHNEYWEVIPEELGAIIHDSVTGTETKKIREAIFIAKQQGEGKIEVYGIYKQTNYQFVTGVVVSVNE